MTENPNSTLLIAHISVTLPAEWGEKSLMKFIHVVIGE